MPESKKVDTFFRRKDAVNKDDDKITAKSVLDKILGDISKTTATKQLLIGTATGWLTGYSAMKVGKGVAFAIGGGIILLEIANEKGYIKINWDKVNKQVDKVSDKVEEQLTGQGPSWMDKMERYVDRKADKAGEYLKTRQTKAGRWYKSDQKLKEIHIFLTSFIAGIAIGIATS